MSRDVIELATPRILVVDDERQIHASLRLRLGKNYELVCCADARCGLDAVGSNRFDLCFVDIHMPHMDGLSFIEAAQKRDPGLGFVVLSAFDSAENLRRTIPLQVFDFVGKPFPERSEFEARIPEWIDRTRRQRHDQAMARQANDINQDLNSARLEREVELVASETARDALLQTAGLLTTIHAHLLSAVATLRAKPDATTSHLLRSLDEARKTTDAAMIVAEGFFDSAYGNRDSSPALLDSGIRHAIDIALRMSGAETSNKTVDFASLDPRATISSLNGIDFLLMMVPAIASALTLADAGSTVRVDGEFLPRLDAVSKDPQLRSYFWLNRKNAPGSQHAVLVSITAACPAFSHTQTEAWLNGTSDPLASITPRGLVVGLKKCRGILGMALPPSRQFRLVLVLPS